MKLRLPSNANPLLLCIAIRYIYMKLSEVTHGHGFRAIEEGGYRTYAAYEIVDYG